MILASKMTLIYFSFLTRFGGVFHFVQKLAKHYDWWDYVEAPPKKKRLPFEHLEASTFENHIDKVSRYH
jgi:hypothetical protein